MTGKRVLILCTGNSCRSQMAEAIWRELGEGEWEVASAGSEPAGHVHPLASRVLSEAGLPTWGARSKNVSEFLGESLDLVITVCDTAKETCPVLPRAKIFLHWPFEDPARAEGTEEEKLEVFRRVRDEIRVRIADHLRSPPS